MPCSFDGRFVFLRRFFRLRDGNAEVTQKTIVDSVDPTVDADGLPTTPCITHNTRTSNVAHLLDNVQLAKSIELGSPGQSLQLLRMFISNVTDGLQPIVTQAQTAALPNSLNTTTTEMTTNNDVPHLQHINGELKY